MAASTTNTYNDSVFINCPFDEGYTEKLHAILFTIIRCGFSPKCALEETDGSNNRLDNIIKLIKKCRYSIHDLSRIELTEDYFPRFNMPFELGLFMGIKSMSNVKRKQALILEKTKYEYQKFISDLSGIDTQAHNDKIELIIKVIRNWLNSCSKRENIPTAQKIEKEFKQFYYYDLPVLKEKESMDDDLSFYDYVYIAGLFARKNSELSLN